MSVWLPGFPPAKTLAAPSPASPLCDGYILRRAQDDGLTGR